MKGFVGTCLAAVGLLAVAEATVSAITITNCDESTLRAALAQGGTVELDCEGTILLQQTLIITVDGTLRAPGRNVFLVAANSNRVIEVRPGVTFRLAGVVIASGRSERGAGLYNDGGNVTVEQCVFRSNEAVAAAGDNRNGGDAWGGAIYNGGTMTLWECLLVQNAARAGAGANGAHGRPGTSQYDQYGRCRPVTPPGNGTVGFAGGNALGGGIYNAVSASLTVVNSTITQNAVKGGDGGIGGNGGTDTGCFGSFGFPAAGGAGGSGYGAGIYNSGELVFIASTLSENTAGAGGGGQGGTNYSWFGGGGSGGTAAGGGLWTSGNARMTNATVYANHAGGGAGGVVGAMSPNCYGANGGAEAGGILSSGTLVAANVTIWNNRALGGSHTNYGSNCVAGPGPAGAVSLSVSGNAYLISSIVGSATSTSNCAGVIIDGGHNICSDHSAAFAAASSRNATDPKLGGYLNHGGPSPTVALLEGSPAIDSGSGAACPAVDQRGFARPQGAACDIGAYEGAGVRMPVVTARFLPESINGGAVARLTLTLSNANPEALSDLAFTDKLPMGVVIADHGGTADCEGNVAAVPGENQFSGSLLAIPPFHACTLTVNVRGARHGTWINGPLEFYSANTDYAVLPAPALLTVTGPEVYTRGVSDVTPNGARFRGTINPLGANVSYYFEYGTSSAYGTQTGLENLTGDGPVDVEAVVTGLSPGTAYYARLVARSASATNAGEGIRFTTPSDIAEVKTDWATGVGYRKATLNGRVVANGWPGSAYFRYGRTTSFENVSWITALESGTNVVPVSEFVEELEPATRYYFQLVAENVSGTFYGDTNTFITRNAAPVCETTPTSASNNRYVVLPGWVAPNEFATRVWFEFGTTSNLGARTAEVIVPGSESYSPRTISNSVPVLECGGTLHYRIVAQSPAGSAAGVIQTVELPGPSGFGLDASSADIGNTQWVTNDAPFTFSAWFRTSDSNRIGLITLYDYVASTLARTLYLNASGQLCFSDDPYLTSALACSPQSYNDGRWHHAAVTYAAQDLRLYADGVSVAVGSPQLPVRRGVWRMGRPWSPVRRLFQLDEVRIWTKVQTAEEIRSGMMRLIPGDAPGLNRYWRFDDAFIAYPWVISDLTGHSAPIYEWRPVRILSTAPLYDGKWIFKLPEGWIKVRLPVPPNVTQVLSYSGDLRTWSPLATNAGAGLLEHLDQNPQANPARFFRAQ